MSETAARPTETPSGIRAVLAANADPEVVERFDKALDLAWAEAKASRDLDPMEKMLRRWWWEAVRWSNPVEHRAFLAYVARRIATGPPPKSQRMNRDQIRERYGI